MAVEGAIHAHQRSNPNAGGRSSFRRIIPRKRRKTKPSTSGLRRLTWTFHS